MMTSATFYQTVVIHLLIGTKRYGPTFLIKYYAYKLLFYNLRCVNFQFIFYQLQFSLNTCIKTYGKNQQGNQKTINLKQKGQIFVNSPLQCKRSLFSIEIFPLILPSVCITALIVWVSYILMTRTSSQTLGEQRCELMRKLPPKNLLFLSEKVYRHLLLSTRSILDPH